MYVCKYMCVRVYMCMCVQYMDYKNGYHKEHPVMKLFWTVFYELPLEAKKKFLGNAMCIYIDVHVCTSDTLCTHSWVLSATTWICWVSLDIVNSTTYNVVCTVSLSYSFINAIQCTYLADRATLGTVGEVAILYTSTCICIYPGLSGPTMAVFFHVHESTSV